MALQCFGFVCSVSELMLRIQKKKIGYETIISHFQKMTLRELREKAREKKIPFASTLSKQELESFLSNVQWSLGWRLSIIRRHCNNELRDIQKAVTMLTSERRDISSIKKISNFLEKHAVVITLTTSPQRLKKLGAVLATLDIEHLTSICIVLPYKYGSKRETYCTHDISRIKNMTPLIQIVRTKDDFGPITKMLPVLDNISDEKAIVISIDDDVAYPFGMVNEMIFQKVVNFPNAVLEGGPPFFKRGDIPGFRKLWPEKQKPVLPHTDFVEGWMSVAYNRKLVDTDALKEFSQMSKKCFLSDDLVISFVLAKNNIKRIGIDNKYLSAPHPYKYGTGPDALHKGAGSGDNNVKASAHSDDYNFEKYKTCLQDICESGKGTKDCN